MQLLKQLIVSICLLALIQNINVSIFCKVFYQNNYYSNSKKYDKFNCFLRK